MTAFTSEIGTNAKCRRALKLSAYRGRPEVIGGSRTDAFDPSGYETIASDASITKLCANRLLVFLRGTNPVITAYPVTGSLP